MHFSYYLYSLWDWLIHPGLPLVALIILAVLVPRIGRLAGRLITRRLSSDEESTKTMLALVGALVYVGEAIAFFIIIIRALSLLGVPAASAAIPATVVSAAIGFGAQNVIGDFLSGFFMISERQFGVGDYVSFDGPNQPVEGTVVALTLRATKIRTPRGEMITIPNGTAGVITNFSQEWSRAYVEIDIPMMPDENVVDLTKQIEDAAADAVNQEDVRRDVTGDITVLPATKLVQPIAAGQPWAVTFRVTVDVTPANQWSVERTIRAALVTAFWDRLNSHSDANPFARSRMPYFVSNNGDQEPQSDEPFADVAKSGLGQEELQTTAFPAVTSDDLTQRTDLDEVEKAEAEAVRAKDDGPGRSSTPHPGASENLAEVAIESEESDPIGFFEKYDYNTKLQRIFSLGGRIRVSTAMWLLALIVVGGLVLASANPEGGQAGVLSPDHWRNRVATTEMTTEPPAPVQEPETEQTPTQTVQPEDSDAPTDTGSQSPGQATGGQAPGEQNQPNQRDPDRTPDVGSTPDPLPDSIRRGPANAPADQVSPTNQSFEQDLDSATEFTPQQ